MRERRARREKASRAPWYLLTGFLLGLAGGAAFSIWWWPVPYDFALPSDMNPASRDQYRLLIARTYYADGDSGRALPRLNLLKDSKPEEVLSSQAQVELGRQNDLDSTALARLALILDLAGVPDVSGTLDTPADVETTVQPSITEEAAGGTSNPEETPETGTPYPTIASLKIPGVDIQIATPTMFPTLSAPYILKDRATDCGRSLRPGLLQIWVENATGLAMPGVRIQINWKDGEEIFYTGLKPDINSGYADFEMTPGTVYSLRVGDNGETIAELGTVDCTSAGYPDRVGGVNLRFTER